MCYSIDPPIFFGFGVKQAKGYGKFGSPVALLVLSDIDNFPFHILKQYETGTGILTGPIAIAWYSQSLRGTKCKMRSNPLSPVRSEIGIQQLKLISYGRGKFRSSGVLRGLFRSDTRDSRPNGSQAVMRPED